ncbi:MAG: glycoside hydrolase family 88 protein [Oceanipulchritudo sp.]
MEKTEVYINAGQSDCHKGDHPYGSAGEVFSVEPGKDCRLEFDTLPVSGERIWLRLTVAVDVERDLRLSIRPEAGPAKPIEWEIRKPCFWQVFEVELTPIREQLLRKPRMILSLQDPEDCSLCLYRHAPESIHTPHLLAETPGEGGWSELEQTLCSHASLQPFGWLEGCVLDGISALLPDPLAASALDEHWKYFLEDDGALSYLNPAGDRIRKRLYSIESTLPFANPPTEGLDWNIILNFWESNQLENGLVADINVSPVGKPSTLTGISAEGCYTVAYPMAKLGELLGKEQLFEQAQVQLRERNRILFQGHAVYQKQYIGRELYFPNWARALGWFLIGHGETLRHIPRELWDGEVVEHFKGLCRLAIKWQLKSGLWAVFIDRKLDPDTSGSSAILAGLSIACSLGLLEMDATEAIQKGIMALEGYISADGLLRGCAQLNRGGEELQVSPYRVIAPFAMGLAVRAYHEWLAVGQTSLKAE